MASPSSALQLSNAPFPFRLCHRSPSAASIAAEPPSLPLGPRSLPPMLMRLCNGPYPHGPKKALGDTRYAFPLLISPVGRDEKRKKAQAEPIGPERLRHVQGLNFPLRRPSRGTTPHLHMHASMQAWDNSWIAEGTRSRVTQQRPWRTP
jgi:hypothetical protein